jgi:nicotinamide riboside kinase
VKVINLIGGPNTGKSTTAFGLMYRLKQRGVRVEYAAEYAKEMVHEHRSNILEDQLYILAKQNRRILRLKDSCEYIVTDTSLLLNIVYDRGLHPTLTEVAKSYFADYDNLIYFLPRNYDYRFDSSNRVQSSHEESEWIDAATYEVIRSYDPVIISPREDYVETILRDLDECD